MKEKRLIKNKLTTLQQSIRETVRSIDIGKNTSLESLELLSQLMFQYANTKLRLVGDSDSLWQAVYAFQLTIDSKARRCFAQDVAQFRWKQIIPIILEDGIEVETVKIPYNSWYTLANQIEEFPEGIDHSFPNDHFSVLYPLLPNPPTIEELRNLSSKS